MAPMSRVATPGRASAALFLGAAAVFVLLIATPLSAATTPNSSPGYTPEQKVPTPLLRADWTMPAYLNGSVVSSTYTQGAFIGNYTGARMSSGMEPIVGGASIGV